MSQQSISEHKVAVLVDCDNVTPDILEFALKVAAQFGRVVVRRGYGNYQSLANRWQDALVQLAFTPCLQYQYAAGKNTSDLALALDALEMMFDKRTDTFCMVTCDSDFAYLCRKLRERGARVCIIGEAKTPNSLRNASDQFFEWTQADPAQKSSGTNCIAIKQAAPQSAIQIPPAKKLPNFLLDAVALLVSDTAEGKIGLEALGQYLKRTNPAFSPKVYGHSGLLKMVKSYDSLVAVQETSGNWSILSKPAKSR